MKILINEAQFRVLVENLTFTGSIDDFLKKKRPELKSIVNEYDTKNGNGFDDYQFNEAVRALINLQKLLRKADELTLYRVVKAEDENKINVKNLGNHFTYDMNVYEDVASLYDIGFKNNDKLFLITITTSSKNIDISETIDANITYPHEREIFLNKFDGVNVINISPFKIELPSWMS